MRKMYEHGIFRGNTYEQYTQKEMLRLLSKKKMQIKTTMRHKCTPI